MIVVKSHFICFDFQKTFHTTDIFCALSRLFVRLGFRFALCSFGCSLFFLLLGFTEFNLANFNGNGNEYNHECVMAAKKPD